MQTLALDYRDPAGKKIIEAALPGYNGRRLSVEQISDSNKPFEFIGNYWEGGSRNVYTIVSLETFEAIPLGSAHPMFEGALSERLKHIIIPPNFCVVQHHQGGYEYVKIWLHAENMQKMVRAPQSLTVVESMVLYFTRSLKSSYAGIPNFRFSEANRISGVTSAEWEYAKTALIQRGLLNRAGAITPAGKNALVTFGSGAINVNGWNIYDTSDLKWKAAYEQEKGTQSAANNA